MHLSIALVYREENKFGLSYLNFHKSMLSNVNQSHVFQFLLEELRLSNIKLLATEFTFGLEFDITPTIKRINFGEITKRLNVDSHFCILINVFILAHILFIFLFSSSMMIPHILTQLLFWDFSLKLSFLQLIQNFRIIFIFHFTLMINFIL